MLTKDAIVALLTISDKAVARALSVVNRNQTVSEQASESTINRNGEGFRPCHARMGTSMALFFEKRGYLTEKQIAYWRKTDKSGAMRIAIYWRQLAEAAEAKAATKTSALITTPTHDLGNLCEEQLTLNAELASYTSGALGTGRLQDMRIDRIYDRLQQINEATEEIKRAGIKVSINA